MKVYRQGDVLILEVSEMPDTASVVQPGRRGYVLAEGESTGHAHVVEVDPDVEVRSLEEALFIRVGKTAVVRHEEHAPIQLPEGTYRVVRQVEYEPSALRRVMD